MSQLGGQLDLEIGKALEMKFLAEARHRRGTDAALLRKLGDAEVNDIPGSVKNPLGQLALGQRETRELGLQGMQNGGHGQPPLGSV
ncbi:hypothetical protein D3C71_1478970 [compost metagenome]